METTKKAGYNSDIKQSKIQVKSIRPDQGHFLMLKAAIHNDNITLLSVDKSEDMEDINNIINKVDFMEYMYIWKLLYSDNRNTHLSSSANGTFTKIDYILGHKENISKFYKIEIL